MLYVSYSIPLHGEIKYTFKVNTLGSICNYVVVIGYIAIAQMYVTSWYSLVSTNQALQVLYSEFPLTTPPVN